MENYIKKKSSEISETFLNIANQGCNKIFQYNIDISKLNPNYATNINITEKGDFIDMFKELMQYEDLPAIYMFKINPEIDSKIIINAIDSIDKSQSNIPAHYKKPINNGVLYIGKVKSFAWGRLIQHLGFHKNTKSHGLHLYKWASTIQPSLDLSYTVFFFHKEVAPYLELIENELSENENYKPIIGKH